jgi:hypothetical protein
LLCFGQLHKIKYNTDWKRFLSLVLWGSILSFKL